jgi:acetate kinase
VRILVVNAGSSSLKLRVLNPHDDTLADHHVEDWDGEDVDPVAEILDRAGPVDVVAHRIVHGGRERAGPARVTNELVDGLRELTPLAPLHQGRSVAGIVAARAAAPDLQQVACFDTAYHTTLPAAAATYALPEDWRRRWPLRRYGFHGLSHAYAARRAADLARHPPAGPDALRVVTCHLGAGASLCASRGGRAADTTMGFTPLEGLVMATRAGTVDPGLVLWLISDAGLSPDDVRYGLEHRAGLSGLTGTADMRTVLDRRTGGDADAELAFEVYVHAIARHVGAMTAAIGGIDVLVFTAGVGERSPEVRAAVTQRLAYLGVEVGAEANASATAGGDLDISAAGAPVATLVVEAREDLEMARQTRTLLVG